jgi:agmatine deiminase
MSPLVDSTPRADGFRMPAEWEPHAGTWLLWPERPDAWRLGAKPAQHTFAALASAIGRFEPVTMGVNHGQFRNARNVLPPSVRVIELSSNDSWMRDCGPTFVVNDRGDVRLVDWDFNAWGGLKEGSYWPWDKDDMVPEKVADLLGVDRHKAPLVMEGGALHVDGEGTVLVTEENLLHPNRNPELTKGEIERHLLDYLGAEKVLWMGRGFDPHVTNGHVDEVACFTQPGVVLLAWTDDASDWRHEICAENLARLEAATDARGRRLEVHKLPLPDEVVLSQEEAWGLDRVAGATWRDTGRREPASYVNFYICNGAVIVPSFGDARDEEALAIIAAQFPDREAVSLPGHEVILNGGCFHCITQQQPAARQDPRRMSVGT